MLLVDLFNEPISQSRKSHSIFDICFPDVVPVLLRCWQVVRRTTQALLILLDRLAAADMVLAYGARCCWTPALTGARPPRVSLIC